MNNVTAEALAELARQALQAKKGMGDRFLAGLQEAEDPFRRFLHLLVKTYRPRAAVELGVYLGVSTAHMAAACPDTLVVGVDIAPHAHVANATSRYQNIRLVTGDSVESAPEVERLLGERRIGLLFLDSLHDGITPRREVEAYGRLLADVAVICCDDLRGSLRVGEQMGEFWRWLPGEKVDLDELHPPVGFGACIWRRGA